jgi:hypothetical protein
LRERVRWSVCVIRSRIRVWRLSRFTVEKGEEGGWSDGPFVVVVVVGRGERVVVKVVICEDSDVRVGRIGVDDVGEVVERPRLFSRAVRRSERVARDVRVDGEGSDGAGF